MKRKKHVKHGLFGLALAATIAAAPAASASDLAKYLEPISGQTPAPTPEELATRNVLQLNTSMFTLYESAGVAFRTNILAKHPVILALFSGSGGRMILYKP
eukprot:gene19384-24782_t